MYSYHALSNALSAHIIHINLNTIFHTHVEDSPTKIIYIRHYMDGHTHTHIHTHTHTHTHVFAFVDLPLTMAVCINIHIFPARVNCDCMVSMYACCSVPVLSRAFLHRCSYTLLPRQRERECVLVRVCVCVCACVCVCVYAVSDVDPCMVLITFNYLCDLHHLTIAVPTSFRLVQ